MLKATPRDLHLALSAASRGAVSMVWPLIFRSLRTFRLHVSFGRPLFLFPWGVQRGATLGSELGACRRHDRASVFLDGLRYYRHPKFFWAVLRSRWRFASRSWGYVESIWLGRLFLWCHRCFPAFWSIRQEDAENSAVKDPDLSLDVKSSESLFAFQHCKSLVDLLILVLVSLSQSPVSIKALQKSLFKLNMYIYIVVLKFHVRSSYAVISVHYNRKLCFCII